MVQGSDHPDGHFARRGLGADVNALLDHFERKTITLGDTESAALSDDVVTGHAHIYGQGNDSVVVVSLLGDANGVSIAHQAGSATFGTSSGTDNQINVYWDSGNSQYEIENQSGSELTFEVLTIRGP